MSGFFLLLTLLTLAFPVGLGWASIVIARRAGWGVSFILVCGTVIWILGHVTIEVVRIVHELKEVMISEGMLYGGIGQAVGQVLFCIGLVTLYLKGKLETRVLESRP